jgi:hypothetical protein
VKCPATRKERKGKIHLPSGRDFSVEILPGGFFILTMPVEVIR